MPGPHDALFKAAFEQPANAAALVRRCLSSELQARFDWSTMRLLPGSFVDPELRASHSDLVFVVASFAGPVLVYVLLEHQSSNDVRMTLRVLCYMDRSMPLWVGLLDRLPKAALEPIVHYLARLVGERVTWDLFRANLQQLAPNAEGTVMSLADQWFAEGEARGEARGRAEGEARGRAALLAKQLTLKFGELPEPVRERLLNANIDELDRWAERVLVAISFTEVFAD
jgi:predicted transposase YdaD